MNKFDKTFFTKYVSEWSEIKWIIHKHFLVIFDKILLSLFFWVFLPSFFYYFSDRIKEIIPFFVFEIIIIWIFFKVIYDIIDWYNDVWIITDDWIVDLDWQLFWADSSSVKYWNIEWLQVEQTWIIDTILNKWTLILHKIWSDNFVLENANKPYDWANEIEKNRKEKNESIEEEDDKKENFDIIMDALSWVVEDYLEKKWLRNRKDEEKEKYIEKIKNKNWSIDIR